MSKTPEYNESNDAIETIEIVDAAKREGDETDFWCSELDSDVIDSMPDYADLTLIGQGGMSAVFQARDLRFDREVAIKLLAQSQVNDAAMRFRLEQEARNTASLRHPGVVTVYETGATAKGRPFFSMKLINGRNLRSLTKAKHASVEEPLDRLKIFLHISRTIAFSHSCGIVHLDLKPANVMLGDQGEVHVMDWGISRSIDSCERFKRPLKAGQLPYNIVGTPAYMAPEQARGIGIGNHTDVFGLGAILCELLTGHPPFRPKNVRAAFRRCFAGRLGGTTRRLDKSGEPIAIISLAKRCLSIDPTHRPTASQVADVVSSEIENYPNHPNCQKIQTTRG